MPKMDFVGDAEIEAGGLFGDQSTGLNNVKKAQNKK
jgi:hypothetical protein